MSNEYYITDNINLGYEDEEKIRKACFEYNFDDGSYSNSGQDGIPVISDGHMAYCYPTNQQPFLAVGSTGSGKTRRILIPYLLTCIRSGCSMVVNDPKGELLKYSQKELKKAGYKIHILDYRNPECGDRYNLLKYPYKMWNIGRKNYADELTQSLYDSLLETVKDDKNLYWTTTASAYLCGLTELAYDLFKPEKISINTIYDIHIQGNKRFDVITTYLEKYLKSREGEPYYKLISPYLSAPPETRGCLESTLTSAISMICRNESVIDQNCDSTFDIENIVEDKTALFIISRDEGSVYNSLISAVINQIYQVLIDIAESKYNGRLENRIVFLLDEFSNMTPIDDINSKITISRSRNIGFCLGVQSLDQLSIKYGTDIARIILANCNLGFMYSNDISLLRLISQLCGEIVDEYTQVTRPLLSIEKLRYFNKEEGQVLFLLERRKPYCGYLPDISIYQINSNRKTVIKRRNAQKKVKINFQTIVKYEERADINKRSRKTFGKNNEYEDEPYDGPGNEAKRRELEKRIIKELKEVDKKIEEMEKAKGEVDQKIAETMFAVELIKIDSYDDTAIVIGECMGVPIEACDLIRDVLLQGKTKINRVPGNVVNKMINKLKKVGTIAEAKEGKPFK